MNKQILTSSGAVSAVLPLTTVPEGWGASVYQRPPPCGQKHGTQWKTDLPPDPLHLKHLQWKQRWYQMFGLCTGQQCCWWLGTCPSETTQSLCYRLTQSPRGTSPVPLADHSVWLRTTPLKCWFAWKLTGKSWSSVITKGLLSQKTSSGRVLQLYLSFTVILLLKKGKISTQRHRCCSFIKFRSCTVERAHFLYHRHFLNKCCSDLSVAIFTVLFTAQLGDEIEEHRLNSWSQYQNAPPNWCHPGMLLRLLAQSLWAIWTGTQFPLLALYAIVAMEQECRTSLHKFTLTYANPVVSQIIS